MSSTYTLNETGEQVQSALTEVHNKTIYGNATQEAAGLMSAEDKQRLDNADTTVTEDSAALVTSGAVYSHVASALGDISTILDTILGEE